MARIIEIDDQMTSDRDVMIRYPRSSYGYDSEASVDTGGFSGRLLGSLALIFLVLLVLWNNEPGVEVASTPLVNQIARKSEGILLAPVVDVKYVAADNLNMRVKPDNYADVSYVLPRATRLELLGEAHQEWDGDRWARVRVNTPDGVQQGWVRSQYIQ